GNVCRGIYDSETACRAHLRSCSAASGEPGEGARQISAAIGRREERRPAAIGDAVGVPWEANCLPLQSETSFRLAQISRINLEPDKSFHAAALRRDGRVSDSEKGIEHRLHA